MNRVRQPQSEVMAAALAHVPCRLREHVACDLFCGDPVFAGIYAAGVSEWVEDGRSYRTTAHVCWPYHVRDGRSTIVMPHASSSEIALHELGHVLEERLAERAGWDAIPLLDATSVYSEHNRYERFAEAFVVWCAYPPECVDREPYWPHGWSPRNAEWFDRLLAT